MSIISISRPLLAGVLHSFEPDHVTAVSVLAAENATTRRRRSWRMVFRASQWAFGHSVTLIFFGIVALLFKASLQSYVKHISLWAEIAVGPIMILLGVQAIRRNYKLNEVLEDHMKIEDHAHNSSRLIHIHGKRGEEIAANPLNRSFWVGMLHGLAGTGGFLTSALIISATTMTQSIMVIVVESAGIIVAMGVYSYVLVTSMSRFLERNMSVFKWINAVAGLAAIAVGCYWIFNVILEALGR